MEKGCEELWQKQYNVPIIAVDPATFLGVLNRTIRKKTIV